MEMEKLSISISTSGFPPGFRFEPTDEELVFRYLKCKVFSLPLPASIIPEITNLFNHNPWDLSGGVETDYYFFSKKEIKYKNGKRRNRASGSGYWKASSSDKHIVRRNNAGHIYGIRKTFVFHMSKKNHELGFIATNWVMHEYSLATTSTQIDQELVVDDNWLLCHLFLRNTNRRRIKDNPRRFFLEDTKSDEHFIKSHQTSSSSSSSTSSTIT